MNFVATRTAIGGGHGAPPVLFLTDLVNWCREAPDDLFAPNDVPMDIFAAIKTRLATSAGLDGAGGPVYHWESLLHRRAAFCEAARVHAGRESGWNYDCDVDTTNQRSLTHIEEREAGIFQVSFNSVYLPHGEKEALWAYAVANGIDTPRNFIARMKFRVEERSAEGRRIVFDYYARLMRLSIAWAGPFVRHNGDSVYPYLSRASMAEFESLLA